MASPRIVTVTFPSAQILDVTGPLESTRTPIDRVATTCGFGTPETMNRTFRRRLNTTPGGHRRHFGAIG